MCTHTCPHTHIQTKRLFLMTQAPDYSLESYQACVCVCVCVCVCEQKLNPWTVFNPLSFSLSCSVHPSSGFYCFFPPSSLSLPVSDTFICFLCLLPSCCLSLSLCGTRAGFRCFDMGECTRCSVCVQCCKTEVTTHMERFCYYVGDGMILLDVPFKYSWNIIKSSSKFSSITRCCLG